MRKFLEDKTVGQPVKRYVEFAWYRALAEIRADVSRGFLGFAWWVIEPLLYMGTFYVIFGMILQQRGDKYAPFLLCGLVAWKWFASSIQNGSTSVTRNMSLIYQVYLPKVVFPFIAIITSTLRFAFVFVIFLLFLITSETPVTTAWVMDLPMLLLLQFVLMLGLAMTLAAIEPFIPDLKFLVDNGMLLLFFLSGIFFRFDAIPELLRPYFELNPIAVIIHGYREVLVNGGHVRWITMLPVAVTSICFLMLGWALLKHWDHVYAKKAFL